jgi:lysophospholipase L1-like esterase
MSRPIAWPGKTLLVLGLVIVNLWLWVIRPPGQHTFGELVLQRPFEPDSGLAYIIKLPMRILSDETDPYGSSVQIMENGKRLGPAHSAHAVIRKEGAGRFSHWGDKLWFSSSDNTDPNRNGRQYSIRYLVHLPAFLYLGGLLLNYLLLVFVVDRFINKVFRPQSRLRTLFQVFAIFLISVGLIQVAFWVLTYDVISNRGEGVRQWYDYSFRGEGKGFSPGDSINYLEHHYLNYALNPDVPYGDSRQFNAQYRIRRSEPIRERSHSRLRIIALGGSTTFGEKVRKEEDTWIYQLEKRVRGSCGDTCDVINGGVGGYTILENFIHYVTLLTELEPDVVLLYEGINDVDARLFGNIRFDYSNYRNPWRSEGWVLPKINRELAWLYPYRYYFLNSKIIPLRQTGIGGVVGPPHPPPAEWGAALKRNGAQVYRSHLRNLVQLIKGQGRQVIVLPQHYIIAKAGDEIFIKGVQEHNQVNRELAEEMGLPFLQDLMDFSTFDRHDTFDNCHFNERGSIKMANLVFEFLQSKGLIESKLTPLSQKPSK